MQSLLDGATRHYLRGQPARPHGVRLRGIGVLPQTSSSVTPIGGHVEASDPAVPEIDATYFFTDNIAAEAIAATTRSAPTTT